MSSGALKRDKREVRRRVLALRDALPAEERERMGIEIVRRFLGLPEVASAGAALAFWSFGSEVPTEPLIEALHGRGTLVALPRIVAGELDCRSYRPGDEMTETTFGALEPADGRPVDAAEIDVIAVPGVAFDRDGRRVGYGGGFYDRFLPRTHPETCRIGIGFGVQLLPAGEPLPAGHFDQRIDVVVTEAETVRCRRSA
ncbi:MAG TPA: 5-formyltetrahydrofolate cyclo-ligase [Actinomycetota bacterium]|jgi:5-formyltetrahydrofolate cyclo-ligase|nr:5-formyltetrahydrofolate cyclo-ligase [Actinomycetota bacterium]